MFLYHKYCHTPSPPKLEISLIIFSTKEKATPRFLCFTRMFSLFEDALEASYFKHARSFRRTAISTLDDSKISRMHLKNADT